jgi:hypothetical protein
MTTYKSYSELKGKTLTPGNIVIFCTDEYRVNLDTRYLNRINGRNDQVFHACGITNKYDLADTVYGYENDREGVWPNFELGDYKALTRLVLVLFQFLEGKENAEVDIDGNKFLVDKSGAKVYITEAKRELTVPSEFVRNAYNAASAEWKIQLKKEIPEMCDSLAIGELEKMALECYTYNKKNYAAFSYCGNIKAVRTASGDLYVAVQIPNANTEWTLSAYAFVRDFVDYMKIKELIAYPKFYKSTFEELSSKLGWDFFVPVYVKSPEVGAIYDDYKISAEFVLEAHEAACAEWKAKIEKQFPELFKSKKIYPIGTKVLISTTTSGTQEYMLVDIGSRGYLVHTKNGNTWAGKEFMNIIGVPSNDGVAYSEIEKYVGITSFDIVKK